MERAALLVQKGALHVLLADYDAAEEAVQAGIGVGGGRGQPGDRRRADQPGSHLQHAWRYRAGACLHRARAGTGPAAPRSLPRAEAAISLGADKYEAATRPAAGRDAAGPGIGPAARRGQGAGVDHPQPGRHAARARRPGGPSTHRRVPAPGAARAVAPGRGGRAHQSGAPGAGPPRPGQPSTTWPRPRRWPASSRRTTPCRRSFPSAARRFWRRVTLKPRWLCRASCRAGGGIGDGN